MNEELESIAQLWRWFAVGVFLYTLGLWIRTQTDNFEPVKFAAKTEPHAVVLGLLASPAILVVLWLASRYATLASDLSRWERVPPIFEKGLRGPTGLLFRGSLGLAAMAIPVASQVHFLRLLMDGPVVLQVSGRQAQTLAEGWIEMLTIRPFVETAWFCNDYRFTVDGPTFFPLVESWCLLVCVIAVNFAFMAYLTRYLRVFRSTGR